MRREIECIEWGEDNIPFPSGFSCLMDNLDFFQQFREDFQSSQIASEERLLGQGGQDNLYNSIFRSV